MSRNAPRFLPSEELVDREAEVEASGFCTTKDKQSPLPSLGDLRSGNPVEEVVEIAFPWKELRKPTLHHTLTKREVERLACFDNLSKLHDTKVAMLKFTANFGDIVNGTTSQSIVPAHCMTIIRTKWSVLFDQV